MAWENSRFQALESAVEKADRRLDGFEQSLRNFGGSLDALSGRIPHNNPVSPRWQIATSIAAIAGVLLTAVFGGIGLLQAHQGKVSLQGQVTRLQSDLQMVTAVVAPQLLHRLGAVITAAATERPSDASQSARSATKLLNTLQSNRVPVPQEQLLDLNVATKHLVEAHQDLPEAWSLAGQYINYKSQVMSGWSEVNLPLCTNKSIRMAASNLWNSGETVHAHIDAVQFKSCKIVLDTIEGSALLSRALTIADVVFDHCAVFYGGGEIDLVPQRTIPDLGVNTPPGEPATLHSEIRFQDCSFQFSLPNPPPPRGRKFAGELLMAASSTIQLEIG